MKNTVVIICSGSISPEVQAIISKALNAPNDFEALVYRTANEMFKDKPKSEKETKPTGKVCPHPKSSKQYRHWIKHHDPEAYNAILLRNRARQKAFRDRRKGKTQ